MSANVNERTAQRCMLAFNIAAGLQHCMLAVGFTYKGSRKACSTLMAMNEMILTDTVGCT